jgi:energy-coupling factor transport system ATP-binding protein
LVGKKAPLDVAAGRRWLMDVCSGATTETVSTETVSDAVSPVEKKETAAESVIEVKGAWMRYERDLADVLKGLSLTVRKGEILALVGGNGAGKSTLMKLMAGGAKPYRGKVVRSGGPVSMMTQNPQLLFTEDTLEADLRMIATNEEELGRVTALLQLAPLLTSHPFDLSGGEQQRAALAKVLLSGADVILLDEPTKGLDEGFKEIIGNALRSFVKDGGTVVVTTHDVDFCARTADRCAMLFNGQITGEGTANTFFHGNEFYTTAANRMSRGILDALFAEEIVEKIKAMER